MPKVATSDTTKVIRGENTIDQFRKAMDEHGKREALDRWLAPRLEHAMMRYSESAPSAMSYTGANLGLTNN